MNKNIPVRSQGKVEMDKGEFELYVDNIKLENGTQIFKIVKICYDWIFEIFFVDCFTVENHTSFNVKSQIKKS
jgi:hypothetical protein